MRVQVFFILLALTFIGCSKRPNRFAAGQCFHLYLEDQDHKGWVSHDLRIVAVRGHSYLYDEIEQGSPPRWTREDGRSVGGVDQHSRWTSLNGMRCGKRGEESSQTATGSRMQNATRSNAS